MARLALIPGTSRSGITMTAGRTLGLSREASARFSMLMSLPIIGASGLYAMLKLMRADAAEQSFHDLPPYSWLWAFDFYLCDLKRL